MMALNFTINTSSPISMDLKQTWTFPMVQDGAVTYDTRYPNFVFVGFQQSLLSLILSVGVDRTNSIGETPLASQWTVIVRPAFLLRDGVPSNMPISSGVESDHIDVMNASPFKCFWWNFRHKKPKNADVQAMVLCSMVPATVNKFSMYLRSGTPANRDSETIFPITLESDSKCLCIFI